MSKDLNNLSRSFKHLLNVVVPAVEQQNYQSQHQHDNLQQNSLQHQKHCNAQFRHFQQDHLQPFQHPLKDSDFINEEMVEHFQKLNFSSQQRFIDKLLQIQKNNQPQHQHYNLPQHNPPQQNQLQHNLLHYNQHLQHNQQQHQHNSFYNSDNETRESIPLRTFIQHKQLCHKQPPQLNLHGQQQTF